MNRYRWGGCAVAGGDETKLAMGGGRYFLCFSWYFLQPKAAIVSPEARMHGIMG